MEGKRVGMVGFDWRLGKGFFIIGRVPGLVAHVYEELTMEKTLLQKIGRRDRNGIHWCPTKRTTK